MKKITALLASTTLLFGGAITSTAPASARPVDEDAIATGWKFWTGDLCIANGDNDLPIGTAVQRWNEVTSSLSLHFQNRCSAYPPSRRMTVTSFISGFDHRCGYMTNTERDSRGRWTNNPVLWLNAHPADNCADGGVRTPHTVSMYIGFVLGLDMQTSPQFLSRVMCRLPEAWHDIKWATIYDGRSMDVVY